MNNKGLHRTIYALSAVWGNRLLASGLRFTAFFLSAIVSLTALPRFTYSHNPLQSTKSVAVSPTKSVAQNSNMARIDLNAISQIESSGNPKAVGDGGKALGQFQLHYPLIQDFNRWNGTQYPHKAALNPITARKIADWSLHTYFPKILRRMGLEPTTDRLIVCFNAGCGALKRKNLPKTTQNYLKKYKGLTYGT